MDALDHPHMISLPHIIALNDGGDAVLQFIDNSKSEVVGFLISTSLVKPASKVFRRLFEGHFVEARSFEEQERPYIQMYEDDADSMAIVLRVLHHDHESLPKELDREQIARLAIHSDKYDCVGVLRPWILSWIARMQPIDSNDSIGVGLQILATYIVRAASEFAAATALAHRILKPTFQQEWMGNDVLQMIPDAIEGKVGCVVKEAHCS